MKVLQFEFVASSAVVLSCIQGRVPRTEDLIIGHTWKLYIEADEGDDIPEMVVLLPMTKVFFLNIWLSFLLSLLGTISFVSQVL